MRGRWVLSIVGSLLIVLLGATSVAASSGWTAPALALDGHYYDARMVVDGHGSAHVVARGDTGIWYLTNETGAWGRTRLSRDHASGRFFVSDVDPHIAFDRTTGRLAIVYAHVMDDGGVGGCYVDGYRVTWKIGGTWSSPTDIPLDCRTGILSIAARNGRLAIVRASYPGDAYGYLDLVTNAGGQWQSETIASHESQTGWQHVPLPTASLGLDDRGLPWVVFVKDGWLRLARGTRATGGFVKERVAQIPGTASPGYVPRVSLALTAANAPRIAWTTPDGTFYLRRAATGWRTETVSTSDSADIALALDGHDHPTVAIARGGAGVWVGARSAGAWTTSRLDAHRVDSIAGLGIGPAGRARLVYTRGDRQHARVWFTHST